MLLFCCRYIILGLLWPVNVIVVVLYHVTLVLLWPVNVILGVPYYVMLGLLWSVNVIHISYSILWVVSLC